MICNSEMQSMTYAAAFEAGRKHGVSQERLRIRSTLLEARARLLAKQTENLAEYSAVLDELAEARIHESMIPGQEI